MLLEGERVDAAELACIAIRRERVVGARGVVAATTGR